MNIAMLTYSVKPRGGVEHALAIAEALAGRGHEVCVSALAPPGETFFRETSVATRLVEHVAAEETFDARILGMVGAYREGLRPLLAGGGFDLVHAQDCISANAALDLRDEGAIEHVVRTVHHVDDFISPSLIACQDRSILAPDLVLCVSSPWIERV
ncbi:MAG: glycosyltransferase, partial [Actinobacteria bacterium]|nr:glycosyltransferase [Actinomycetota bacterium]